MQIRDSGFTTAELLISLFVVALAFFTSYQLYGVIVRDGADSQERAIASNLAYEQLTKYTTAVGDLCVANNSPTPAPEIPANTRLRSPTISASISCPYGTTSKVSKIAVKVTYGSADNIKEVNHATYVAKD